MMIWPAIRKFNYEVYNKQGKLTKVGYIYRFVWNKFTVKGFDIPFTKKLWDVSKADIERW